MKKEIPAPMIEWWTERVKAGAQITDETLRMCAEFYDYRGDRAWKQWIATPPLHYDYREFCKRRAAETADKFKRREYEREAANLSLSSFSMQFMWMDKEIRKSRSRVKLVGTNVQMTKFRNGYRFEILPAHQEVMGVWEGVRE